MSDHAEVRLIVRVRRTSEASEENSLATEIGFRLGNLPSVHHHVGRVQVHRKRRPDPTFPGLS